MNTREAIALIRTPLIEWAQPQSWCDLGSGSGTFTVALAELLAPGSRRPAYLPTRDTSSGRDYAATVYHHVRTFMQKLTGHISENPNTPKYWDAFEVI